MVIGIKWFHFIVSFLRDGPSFFRTTSAGKWLRAFGDPLSGLIFSQGSAAPVNPLLSLPFTAFSTSHRGWHRSHLLESGFTLLIPEGPDSAALSVRLLSVLNAGHLLLESGSTLSTCCAIIARLVGGIARHLLCLPIAQELASATVLDA